MNKHILIVDDERDLFEIVVNVLDRPDWEIDAVHNSTLVIDKLKTGNIDLVVLDLIMPPPDGFEILDWIRSHEITKHIPFVIISASSREDTRKRISEAGANEFVTKPFDFETLETAVEYHLKD